METGSDGIASLHHRSAGAYNVAPATSGGSELFSRPLSRPSCSLNANFVGQIAPRNSWEEMSTLLWFFPLFLSAYGCGINGNIQVSYIKFLHGEEKK